MLARAVGFPGWPSGREPSRQCSGLRFDPEAGKIPRRRHGHPLRCSCLEESTDRGAWRATVHGVTKEWGVTQRLKDNIMCLSFLSFLNIRSFQGFLRSGNICILFVSVWPRDHIPERIASEFQIGGFCFSQSVREFMFQQLCKLEHVDDRQAARSP